LLHKVLALTQTTGARQFEAEGWHVQGKLFAAQHRFEDAAGAFQNAITRCQELGSRLALARALYDRGKLRQTQGEPMRARDDWSLARVLCEEMGAGALLWRIYAALGNLALGHQQDVQAAREFAAARATVAEISTSMSKDFRADLERRAAELIPAKLPQMTWRVLKREYDGLTECLDV
jgi:hypothetical protein